MEFLVAVDGSSGSDRALEHALDVADAMGARLTAVHAVDPSVYQEAGPIGERSDAEKRLVLESIESAEERGREVLEDAVDQAAERGFDLRTELLHGDAVAVIPVHAEAEDFDGIFAGHRDLPADRERMLGSVAKGLIDRSTVPVTVVR